jgi:gliding motility-associated-like protein
MVLSKNIIKPLILLVLFCVNISVHSQFSYNMNPEGERNILQDRALWKEIESERKEFSSAFLTPDGRTITYFSKQPVNYYNQNGILVPVNVIPSVSAKGLTAANQPNQLSVLNNGAVEIQLKDGTTMTYSKNAEFMGHAITPATIEKNGESAVMKNVLPGIDKTFEFRFNSLKYNYVINTPLATTAPVVVEEELELPEGSIIRPDQRFGKEDKNGWMGALSIISKEGKELGTIRGALCYDAANNYTTAAYKIETVNGKQKIKIILSSAWINSSSRVYPVTIDPLVTGPTSVWGGGYIGSCITPASDSDSILVTIPAQISVTGLFVSGSFYASPFTTAIMSQGAMFFRTSCNSSTSFTVSGAAGATAGTGYLTAFDLKSPLLCCKPQSCSIQTFYLSMHIQRTGPATGCNTTYIYHDPFSGYPFSAYVEGHTAESYALQWNVTPNNICSDVCNITGTVYMKYGVPPYTITHPWMTGSATAGTPLGCSAGSVFKAINLTIPGCPLTCDTTSTLSVPPPLVTDACGNIIAGLPAKVITIKTTPEVTASPNPLTTCSGDPFTLTLTPCVGTSVVSWTGNSTGGTGTSINHTITNTGTSVLSTTYLVSAVNNTCNSDTISVTVNTDPLPVADFSISPQPVVINNPLALTDNSSVFGGVANSWFWDFGDGTFDLSQNSIHSYAVPGTYRVCMAMQTSDGCVDTVCRDVSVIPAELVLPNVITPNNDNINEVLYFKYLEYFGNNNLKIYDRWGSLVYEKNNYDNDWHPAKISDGTYYYVLTLENEKVYPGFLQVISN